ncbi:MAG: hypothetical protein L3J18_15075 [Candidatus Brocadia sp.]|nr:hypothetical protein [Candidatus Brocadia sp.]UJS20204.1 MAG: hypothetical protein L3J18_15075 [Candidatus Brocadia sp.]
MDEGRVVLPGNRCAAGQKTVVQPGEPNRIDDRESVPYPLNLEMAPPLQ